MNLDTVEDKIGNFIQIGNIVEVTDENDIDPDPDIITAFVYDIRLWNNVDSGVVVFGMDIESNQIFSFKPKECCYIRNGIKEDFEDFYSTVLAKILVSVRKLKQRVDFASNQFPEASLKSADALKCRDMFIAQVKQEMENSFEIGFDINKIVTADKPLKLVVTDYKLNDPETCKAFHHKVNIECWEDFKDVCKSHGVCYRGGLHVALEMFNEKFKKPTDELE